MKFLGSQSLSIISVVLILFFLIRYWIFLSKQSSRYRYLLTLLRFCSLIFLLFLILNPWIEWRKNEKMPQNISVICDLSESMIINLNNNLLEYNEIFNKIQKWGDIYKLNINFFKLGRKITALDKTDTLNAKYNRIEPNTDFRDIPDFISFVQPQKIILITDGKATIGNNINEIEFSPNYPLYIAGIGPHQMDNDIAITDIMFPKVIESNDSVRV